MLGLPLPDVIAGLALAVVFLIGLAVAYRRGFHAALPLRCEGFDFLAARIDLEGTRWKRTESPDDKRALPQALELWQTGSRVAGSGIDADGAQWRLEGIIHGTKLECLARRVHGGDVHPEVWMLRIDEGLKKISGYQIGWDRTGSRLALRELCWARDESPVIETSDPHTSEQEPQLIAAGEPA